MVNCFPRKFDRAVCHFVRAQIKSVISVLTRLHEPLLVPDRDIVVMTESAHTEPCLYRPSINVCQRNRRGLISICRFVIGHFRPRGLDHAFLFPPPTLRERRHRGLARRLVPVSRRAIFVVPESE